MSTLRQYLFNMSRDLFSYPPDVRMDKLNRIKALVNLKDDPQLYNFIDYCFDCGIGYNPYFDPDGWNHLDLSAGMKKIPKRFYNI